MMTDDLRGATCARLVAMCALAAWASTFPAEAQTADELFDDTQLHDVRLSVHSADWSALKSAYTENTYYPADLQWRGVKVRNVGIRSRGLATRNEFKPGLRIDVNRYVDGQRFLGLRSLVLDNAYRDISMIKDRVAMNLFARLGVPAPRSSHAKVFVNGSLVGVYAITEELDEEFVQRAFTLPESSERDRGTLFEYHWEFPYTFAYLGSSLELYRTLFEPRSREQDSPAELFGPIEEMVRVVNEAPTESFAEQAGARIDLAQVMKYLAIERFMAEYDGLLGYKGMANFYLYRFAHDGRFSLVPWDKDQTFYAANMQIGQGLGDNTLVSRSIAVPELRRVYLDTLAECARIARQVSEGDDRPWLEREVARADAQIRDAVRADPNRWFSFDDYLAEIARMLEFARTRPGFVSCEVGNALSESGPLATCSAPSQTGPR